ncbi:hypothetical protein A2U01_0064437, partial [Trifolium medium]|nr:hypothetical protein [Trifolium medium]
KKRSRNGIDEEVKKDFRRRRFGNVSSITAAVCHRSTTAVGLSSSLAVDLSSSLAAGPFSRLNSHSLSRVFCSVP